MKMVYTEKAVQMMKDFSRRTLQRVRLGDKIEMVTRAVGIKPCAGCKKRKALLNGETL